ncbi:MAG: carboxypeptidase-like regulatory domain-containing protein [Polaribacter sp.]|nr:carboxypeptidase-like regulatory domain-containing protein [Polaribacter sp.]
MKRKICTPISFSKQWFFNIVLFICVNLTSGQTISGKIVDNDTQKPLENVNVFLTKNKSIGTTSDENGDFTLKIKLNFNQNDSISFSMIGYNTLNTTIRFLMENNRIIYLSKSSEILEEITVNSKTKQRTLKFKKITSLPTSIFSFSSIIIRNELYISGGDKTYIVDTFKKAVEKAGPGASLGTIQKYWELNGSFKKYNEKLLIYNLETNIWINTNITLENRAYHQMNNDKDDLYILGGKKLSNYKTTEYLHDKIEVIDTKTSKISVDKTNPHKAVNFASFMYNGNMITMGGSTSIDKNGNKIFTDKIHQYNLQTGLWYELEKMKIAKEVSGLLIENKIYSIGGFNGKALNTIESWDLLTGKWTLEGALFKGIERPGLAYHKNNIYIYDNGTLSVYNIIDNSIENYAINLFLKNAALHFYKDNLYILGGFRETTFSKEPSSDVFTINLEEFKKTNVTDFKKFLKE